MEPSGPIPPPLHELEQAVMEEVWRREQTSVREVMEALNGRGDADRAYTTYMTIMSRLDSKGLLSRRREGKTGRRRWSACMSPRGALRHRPSSAGC